jgi:hypothetical protein
MVDEEEGTNDESKALILKWISMNDRLGVRVVMMIQSYTSGKP